MRIFLIFLTLFSAFPVIAQIRPTSGPFSSSGHDGLYTEPYNRMKSMDEKFSYLSTVLAERLSSCDFKFNPALNFDLVATYYQVKFRQITEPFQDHCSMVECLDSDLLTYIIKDLDSNPQSLSYIVKNYKIEQSIAEDILKTFRNIRLNSQ